MAGEVLINAGAGEIRVALVADGRLQDYSFERLLGDETARPFHSQVGDIILGRVQRVVPGMQAAFVEIGSPRAGFLALREAQSLARAGGTEIGISDCVREGEAILVQIIKDPIGEKGARLSAGITLPGYLVVMTPGQSALSLSRRIEDEEQRTRLLQLGEQLRADPHTGFIFRTAAQGASLEELTQDALALDAIWRGIQERCKTARPPQILYHDLGPIERTMRDMVRGDIARVLIDDAAAAETARAYCRRALPEVEAKIEYVSEPPFERHDLESEIAQLSEPRVALPSGGWITIEATEALTAIDVNSGSYSDASGLEATSLAVNLEAAAEIGRQLRLRGIGGLIVADFIHLAEPAHRQTVVTALTESLSRDRAPAQISPMSEFGIVAITRKRQRESLAQRTSQACDTCHGAGRVPTVESLAQKIIRQIERETRAWPGRELLVTASQPVTDWLNRHAKEALANRARVKFETGILPGEGFDVRPI